MGQKKSTLVLTISIVALVIQACSGSRSQGVFELRLKSFANLLGKDSEGNCCDGYTTSTGQCSGPCMTRFRVCLKHYQATIDPKHECTFGERLTNVLTNNSASAFNKQNIEFPIDFKWPGTFSLIIEAWHETNNKSIDTLISRMATQQQLDAGRDWTQGVHQDSHTKLEYDYRMVCSTHYYGADCDTLCRPRDDQFGHYTCGPNGEKVCLEGYQKDPSNPEGDYCTKAICLQGCDPIHGSCEVPGECKCSSGWSGPLCADCLSYPGCQHGSCEEPWQCNCREGWGGLFCNQDLNYCTNNKPCKNGATCFNTGQGSYTCSCPKGFAGTDCEKRADPVCDAQTCLNGGTCHGTGADPALCICPLGFHGKRCERTADTCRDRPCRNGAACLDGRRGYVCQCPAGYAGDHCDLEVDACRDAPCANGATCGPASDGHGFKCRCPRGFAGPRCDVNVDDCAAGPCQNGATCIDFVDDYKCYCRPGFVGDRCEVDVDNCAARPCQNGGVCRDAVHDFVCTCPPGFAGKDCSVEINECRASPCFHNGFCVDKENDFACRCLPGYSGKRCEVRPDGTVARLSLEEDTDRGQTALIVACSTLVPALVVLAALVLACNKRRHKREVRRANAEARRENALNAVHCAGKTLDDHVIVNTLDYPCPKRLNANPNVADEALFAAKSGSLCKPGVGGGARAKRLNLAPVHLLGERLDVQHCNTSDASSTSSSSLSQCGSKYKESNLPTAASIAAAAALSRARSEGTASLPSRSPSLNHSFGPDQFATEV